MNNFHSESFFISNDIYCVQIQMKFLSICRLPISHNSGPPMSSIFFIYINIFFLYLFEQHCLFHGQLKISCWIFLTDFMYNSRELRVCLKMHVFHEYLQELRNYFKQCYINLWWCVRYRYQVFIIVFDDGSREHKSQNS